LILILNVGAVINKRMDNPETITVVVEGEKIAVPTKFA